MVMKIRNSFLFASMLISSIAFGQGSHLAKATIVILADSSVGETMYLTRFHAPGLDYDYVDSARMTDQAVLFHIIPDPLKEYNIRIGKKYLAGDIYVAPGDSLVFYYEKSHADSLIFDRIGANRSFRDSPRPWYRNRLYYKNFDSLDWGSWQTYLCGLRDSLDKKSEWFGANYPTHTGLREMYESEAIECYYFGLSHYLSSN